MCFLEKVSFIIFFLNELQQCWIHVAVLNLIGQTTYLFLFFLNLHPSSS